MSKYSKFLFSSILLLSTPFFCHADGAKTPLYGLSVFAVVIFMGVWAIESSVINKKIEGSFKKAFYVSFIVNLVTTIIGFLSINLSFLNNFLNKTSVDFIFFFYIFVFILTVFAETVLLYFFYKNERWQNIIKTGLWMNFKSYLFLFLAFAYFFAFPTLGNKLGVLVIVIYFIFTFLRIFDLLKDKLKIKKYVKRTLIVLSIIMLMAAAISDSNDQEKWHISKKYFNLTSLMSSLRAPAEIYYSDNDNSYQNLNCESEEAKMTCEQIEKLTQKKPTFYSSKDEYCVFIKIDEMKKPWTCVDNTGFVATTATINPNGTGYCNGVTFVCPRSSE